jgi:hypothetical protein
MAGSSDETKKRLAEMGYEQELKRSLSMISILGLSFAIIAVPFVSHSQNGAEFRDCRQLFTLD